MALVVLFVVVRALFLTADPPLTLPGGKGCNDLFVEPAAKAHEARNWALFGAWQTSPVDNYQFWRAQSPAWVYPLAGFFRVFGVSYASLRAFAVIASALGFAALLALAARELRGAAFACAGLMLAGNHVAALYDRSGMIEPAVNAHLAVAMLLLLLARRHLLWLIPVQWALVLAFLTKQTGLYAAPVAVVFGLAVWLRAPRAGDRARLYRALVLAHALALLAAVAWYVSRDAYIRSVIWNYGHIVHGEDGHTAITTTGITPTTVLETMENPVKLKVYATLLTVPGALAPLEALRLAVRVVRRRRVSAFSALISLWWLSAVGVLLLTKANEVRYFLILYPPTVLLAGGLMQWALRRLRRPVWRAVAVLAVVAPFLALSGLPYAQWARGRGYSIVQTNDRLTKMIGAEPAVIIGLWAAPLVLQTPYHHYYVKNDFNATRQALVALRVTHLLLLDRNDYTRSIVTQRFPALLRSLTPTATFPIRGTRVRLYPLSEPLR